MKKSLLLVLLVAFLAVSVGISGCLDTNGNNSSNNTTNNTTNNSTPAPEFGSNIVQVNPVPAKFELLAVKNVTANNENIDGLKTALAGYSATYLYNNSTSDSVYLYAFKCADAASAAGFVQSMIDANIEKYPGSNNATTVKINGHNATLITTVVSGSGGGERYELVWTNDSILVVVNGPAARNLIEAIATASNL